MASHRLAALGRVGVKVMALPRPSLLPAAANANHVAFSIRTISSSENKPASHVGIPKDTLIDNPPRTAEDFAEAAKKPRNWISYGYDHENIEDDRDTHAFVNFCMLSIIVVFGSFIIGYLPDHGDEDWSHREAYLELARREKYGRPLVDKEFIPVERIRLPSEEELEGKEVYL